MHQIDDVIHQRYRLAILAFLHETERSEFTGVRDSLGLTDGNLNRHLQILAEAGFIKISKHGEAGRRARTWINMTSSGRTAYAAHIAALRELLGT